MQPRKLLFVAAASLVFQTYGCGTNASNTETSDTTTNANTTTMNADNALTEAEKQDGYALLFDGKTTEGWRTFKNKTADSWSVKDGTLYCKGDSTNKSDMRSDMITTGQYENFDFSIDWKISPQGNSGIIYLASEEFDAAYKSGPEYQIIDDNNFPQKLEDWQKTGANYAMHPAPTAAPKAVGEWNTSRIVKKGQHVEHWLNGQKLLEYEMGRWDPLESTCRHASLSIL